MKTLHKVGFALSAILALASLGIAIYYWDRLPSVIPTHFGFSGQPDDWNPKSYFYVFLIPGLQIVMLGLFGFLYYKPQYSDIPTTLWLTTLKPADREHAFDLIRSMMLGISVWMGLIFTYISYAMNYSAIHKESGLNPYVMFGLMGAMFVWIIWWTIRVYRATRQIIAHHQG